ncbi:MAG: hypothetical protein O7B35_18465 [Deltaproteobacteria bacterium]|nr:hypothetical protein [Deltaproteobacteria bacterium]
MLAMILMFGSASVAAAECTWVLWDKLSVYPSGKPGSERWVIGEAYTTQDKCNSARLEGWEALVKKLKGPRGTILRNQPGRTLAVEGPKGSLMIQQYLCLPDTLDPREKNE